MSTAEFGQFEVDDWAAPLYEQACRTVGLWRRVAIGHFGLAIVDRTRGQDGSRLPRYLITGL
jgi:hypothetical protein